MRSSASGYRAIVDHHQPWSELRMLFVHVLESRGCHTGSMSRNVRDIECWLTDMDGVLVHEEHPVPGAVELLNRWVDTSRRFLVLTNNSIYTPRDLSARLARSGLNVPEENLWTSALATAAFLASQPGEKTAYVVGEAGLTTALHEAGFVMTETDPAYVVMGETRNYSFEGLTKAIRLINAGARFIVTNPDTTGPSADGPLPATGAVAAMVTSATNRQPYVVGKPNPMMFRSAMNRIEAHSETTAMIGDRMDTDIVAGMEAGLLTVLVLSGVTQAEDIETFPYRPSQVLNSVADLVPLL
jgi:NagD protein